MTRRTPYAWLASGKLNQLVRFYQAAAVNTAFGFGIYALIVWAGVNIYIAQIIAQILGVTFNYFTYSRHAFRDHTGSMRSFIFAYVGNYVVSVTLLALFDRLVESDYLAGFLATLSASLINFIVLRSFVFHRRVEAS